MAILFWLLWIINLLLGVLIVWGKGYRSSYGAGVDTNSIMLIGVALVLLGSLVARYYFKHLVASVIFVSLPIAGMLIWYLIDRNA